MLSAKNLFQESRQYLLTHSHYEAAETQALSFLLLARIFNLSKVDVLANKSIPIQPEQEQNWWEMLQRLAKHEPIQYIFGESEFYGRTFIIKPGVLIPRPETEELVGLILQTISKVNASNFQVLDIGTGSGCLAISLALEMPNTEVFALDISPSALEIAQQNAEKHQANIHFIEEDILNKSVLSAIPLLDLIVSNPPYVLESDQKAMQAHVIEYEPAQALFVKDDDPLLFYRHIAEFASQKLAAEAFLFLEIHERFGQEVASLLKAKNFQNIEVIQDFRGKDRFLKAQWQAE